MTLPQTSPTWTERRILFFCFLVSAIEFLIAGSTLVRIEADPKNAFLFGFSFMRILLILGTLLFAGIFLALALHIRNNDGASAAFRAFLKKQPVFYHAAFGLLLLCLVWGWLSLFASPDLFGKWIYSFQRLRPISIALGLAAMQILLAGMFIRGQGSRLSFILRQNKKYFSAASVFFLAIAAATVFIVATKLGLKPDAMFFNVPAMPISGVQFFPLLVFLVLAVFLLPAFRRHFARIDNWKLDLALFLVIYLAAVMVWNAVPYPRHPNTLALKPPNSQPYPDVDSRVHDAGAISITEGYGINFRGYTDKPLYMTFLSVLHRIAGNDYWQIVFLQVCVLAFIPAVLYLLGTSFHGRALGIFIAVVALLRQRNAILLSHVIDASNAKLLLTEVPVFLGLALFTLFAFLWLKQGKPRAWLALLSGGLIGASSLIRLNPLLLFPVVGLLALLTMRKSYRIWLPQLALYTAGVVVMLLPWAISGTNAEGQPWLVLKFLDVINVRYGGPSGFLPIEQTLKIASSVGGPGAVFSSIGADLVRVSPAVQAIAVKIGQAPGFVEFVLNHTLHNFVSAVIALPHSLQYENIQQVSQRVYWQPGNSWQGELPPQEALLVYLNLALIAAGLGYGWARYRWAGLLPAAIFTGYALALGFARNSGARYTVPVDWVIFFYYGLGLILLLTLLKRLLLGSQQTADLPQNSRLPLALRENWKLPLTFLFLLAFSSVVPLANRVDPLKTSAVPAESWQTDAANLLPQDTLASSNPLVGKVYYPYSLKNEDVTFDLMTTSGLKSFLIDRPELAQDLVQGQNVVVGYTTVDGYDVVRFILSLESSPAQLVWPREP